MRNTYSTDCLCCLCAPYPSDMHFLELVARYKAGVRQVAWYRAGVWQVWNDPSDSPMPDLTAMTLKATDELRALWTGYQ